MNNIRAILVATCLGVLLILGTSVYMYLTSPSYDVSPSRSLVGEPYRELVRPEDFLNTEGAAFTLAEHIGKRVILLEFMRYGCANCQRSFPEIRALDETYRDQGLLVVGIHTPQFPHEGVKENVQKALGGAGLTFPIVLDTTYGTWNAYENNYWPRTLLIDMTGTIVYDHIGAGGHDVTEKKLKELLGER